jgi:uncharacterized protein (DUF2141 family)
MRLLLLAVVLLTAVGARTEPAVLVMTLTGITEARGTLIVALHHSAETFMNDEAQPAELRRVKVATTGDLTVRFENMSTGRCAVAAFHDVNDNGALDTNFFYMPTERYGFSRDDNIIMPPTFDEASFEVKPGGNAVTVKLRTASLLGG